MEEKKQSTLSNLTFFDWLMQFKTRKMSNNYFTPTREDIREGYECEIKPINESMDWFKGKIRYEAGHEAADPRSLYNLRPFWYAYKEGRFGPIKIQIGSLDNLRVPYLTKEQIEAEGWILDSPSPNGNYFRYTKFSQSKKWLLIFYKNDNYLAPIRLRYFIPEERDVRDAYERWSDEIEIKCNSVNELRYISKLLNI